MTGEQKQRLAYTFHETATLLGVSYHSVLRLNKRGLLRASNVLRKKLISAREIERFLNETTESSNAMN
jgi:predicted site-specific integrase-resolvase